MRYWKSAMASSAQLRRQIESAATLAGVVSTMKTLSAVRITQFRRAVAALESSTKTLELAVQAVLTLNPELLEVVAEQRNQRVAAIVIGSDRGLCGPFNERVARHAVGLLSATALPQDSTVLSVGGRLQARLTEAGYKPHSRVQPPGNVAATEMAVVEALAQFDDWSAHERAGRIYLIYNRPTRGAAYQPTAVRVMPVDARWLRRLAQRPWPSRGLPVSVGNTELLLIGLVRQFVSHALVQAFASSLAAENAARLAAMDAAERTIDERLAQLRAQHSRARQNAVTAELLEIQAAAAATEP